MPCEGQGLRKCPPDRYIWKLLYIYMLGYDVEFGHMEAVSLISSTKYSDKQVGYMVTSVLLNEVCVSPGRNSGSEPAQQCAASLSSSLRCFLTQSRTTSSCGW